MSLHGGTVRKVLIVDDHDILLRSLARDFRRQGIEAMTARTSEEALAHAAIRPDVAVVDLFLSAPDNGVDLVKQLKARQPSLFCILMSAHMSVAHAVLGVRAGADDVFLKPVTARQVLHRVAEGPSSLGPDIGTPTLDQIEWEHISRVLQDYDGNITHAAEALGVMRQSLQRKILKHAPRVLETDETRRRRKRKLRDTSA